MKITYKTLIIFSIIYIGFLIFQSRIGLFAGFIYSLVFLHNIQKSPLNVEFINNNTSKIKLT